MKEKKVYVKARLNVVRLSGKATLLAGSANFEGTPSTPGLHHGSYAPASGPAFV